MATVLSIAHVKEKNKHYMKKSDFFLGGGGLREMWSEKINVTEKRKERAFKSNITINFYRNNLLLSKLAIIFYMLHI